MRSHLLIALLLSALSTACDLQQPVEPVDVNNSTIEVRLNEGVFISELPIQSFENATLETIRIGIGVGPVTITQSQRTELVSFENSGDPTITQFLGQLNY